MIFTLPRTEMSAFNMNEFRSIFAKSGDQRADIIFLAHTAESAERYEDMCKLMRELVTTLSPSDSLTTEERNLLSVAYKNVIGTRRASWRVMTADEDNKRKPIMAEYRVMVEKELRITCEDVLDLLEKILIKNCEDNVSSKGDYDALVFYLKMAGDYYRYLAESVPNQGNELKAADFYKKAWEHAQSNLSPTHPIRLGLALNYSVCHYEILKDKKAACSLAKSAFDEAISKLDKLDEADYKDSTLIMQLLRDNLTLWTSAAEDGDENLAVEDLSDAEN